MHRHDGRQEIGPSQLRLHKVTPACCGASSRIRRCAMQQNLGRFALSSTELSGLKIDG